jgi:hypothetical protein
MGDRDAGDAAAPRPLADFDEWELATYRESLQKRLALAELPKLSVPREELQRQLDEVLAEQAARERTTGGTDAHP